MKVIKRKARTLSVIVGLIYVCPLSPRTCGGMAPCRLVLLSSLLIPPHAVDTGGLNPAQGIENRPPLSLRGAPKGRRGNPLRYPQITSIHAHVIWRYAVEGIASSRRRLAPRNDNRAYKPSVNPRCSAKGL